MKERKTLVTGIISFAAGALLTLLIAGFVMFQSAPGLMIIEDESPLGYEETIQAIQSSAAENGWKVPAVHEIDLSVAKAGYDVLPVSVIELCHPDHAARILKEDNARVVASMMPCRVSVYETSDGRVIVSRMNTKLVSQVFGGLVQEVMADASVESEEILSAVLP